MDVDVGVAEAVEDADTEEDPDMLTDADEDLVK